ncbi:MAG: sulfatase-like hydrolase/transferase [Candidatus Aminicenantes bacterium]|nr:MAG: sulfatase-like hydrolase/transferase [Candidatus Aminicenantes bacterium]
MGKNKRRKRKKKVDLTISAKKENFQEIQKEEKKILPKRQKKLILYFIPFLILLVIALSFYFLSPKNDVKRENNLNVIIVTLDTLRADRVSCYGYSKAKTPNLDELAKNGVRFDNTVCQAPLTLPSHASLFTGLYPHFHQVRDNGSYYLDKRFKTLAEIFKEREYKTAAFIGAFPVDSRFGLDQGFDAYDDTFREEERFKTFNSERRAEEVFLSFKEWFSENFNHKFFIWIHYYDPHLPYDPPSPYKEQFSDPYDGEVAYSDFYVGKIISLLKEKNAFDRTLIVIAGDHGEGLGEHREIDHGIFLYDTTLKVPLIFCASQNLPSNHVVTSQVRLIDIFPTVLDLTKIPLAEEVHGETLIPYIENKKKRDLVSYIETVHPREMFHWADLKGIVNGKMKFIDAPKPELYDLKKDPKEENNLYQKEEQIASRMKKELDDLIEEFSSNISSRRELSAEDIEKLRALGYIADSVKREEKSSNLADPKDKIEIWYTLQVARGFQRRGEHKKAEELYQKGISMEPNCSLNYLFLSGLYMKTNRLEEAYEVCKKGVKVSPENIPLHDGLAKVSFLLNKYQEALRECDAMLALNNNYFNALTMTGFIYNRLGENEKAIDYLQKAVSIEPENKFLLLDYARILATAGRAEEAIKVYNRLKIDYPDDYSIYQSLGITYGNTGDLKKSIENLKKAIELRPTALAYFNLAVAMEEVGNLKEAIHYMRAYLRTTPEGNTQRKINAQKKIAQWEKILNLNSLKENQSG